MSEVENYYAWTSLKEDPFLWRLGSARGKLPISRLPHALCSPHATPCSLKTLGYLAHDV